MLRRYKEGYIAARNYTRQHPDKPINARDRSLDYDAFDAGWDAGTEAEIQRIAQTAGGDIGCRR